MSNTPRLQHFAADAMVSTINLNSGYINIYSGPQPAAGGGSIDVSCVLLVTLRFGATAFAGPSGGSMGALPMLPGVAIASGTAAWFRLLQSDGSTVIVDGSVGTVGCDMNLSSTTIVIGDTIALSAGTITVPLL